MTIEEKMIEQENRTYRWSVGLPSEFPLVPFEDQKFPNPLTHHWYYYTKNGKTIRVLAFRSDVHDFVPRNRQS